MNQKKITRVYPVRTTRDRWKIPLFCYHNCNESCNIIIINDTSFEYKISENPDYKNGMCSKNNLLEKTYVRIADFDINNPKGNKGPLYESESKVISDNSFKVFIYYPLSSVFEVVLETPSNNGFTLKELLYSIKNLYEYIYREEERTATPQIYNLKKLCTTCGNENLSKYIKYIRELEEYKNLTNYKSLDDCCICCSGYIEKRKFEEMKVENKEMKENRIVKASSGLSLSSIVSERTIEYSKPVSLKCGHIFHNSCIKEWLKKSGTCPICRATIFECNNCDGSGVIYYNFTGVVIPLEDRGNILNRNQTYGIFGIHSYDIEDLVIENLFYDNKKKQLYIDITA